MRFLAIAAAALAGGPLLAGEQHPALAIEGDVAYGEYLASECMGCHQASGAAEGIPAIVGWERASLIEAVAAYQSGARRNAAMEMVAQSLGPEELAAIAAYLQGLAPR